MKSSQLLTMPSLSIVPRIRLSKNFAALFAAALALGLGAESALAQGGYYPQVAPLGGYPFIPNGVPVISNPELNLIESKLTGGATLIIPPVGLNHTASLAEYKAAVQAAATEVAGGGAAPITIASLAAEVAKYRQGPPSQVTDALGSFAAGIIASGSGTKLTQLQALAFNAAKVDPAGATNGGTLSQVLNTAANNGFTADVGSIASSAVSGAVSGSPAPAPLQSAGVKALVANAVSAIANSPAAAGLKTSSITTLGTTVLANPAVAGSTANIDQASSSLLALAVQPYVLPGTMTLALMTAVPATNDNYGAIAQGGLRTNPAQSAAIKAALATSPGTQPYTTELIDSFDAFTSPAGAFAMGAGATYPAAVAAAGATKYPASAPAIVKDVLDGSNALGLVAQQVISRGVAAAIGTAVQNIASSAVFVGGPAVSDVVTGGILGSPISSVGAIARAVALAPAQGGLTPANGTSIGNAAILAAAAASPGNPQDSYSDIAYNLAVTGGNSLFQNAAIAAEVLAIPAAGPTYIAIVSAAAGVPAGAVRSGLVTAGTGASPADDDAATNDGVTLLNNFTNVPLANYEATLARIAAPLSGGEDVNKRNLALLYAASLGNPGDAAGSLAALIAKTATSPTSLTGAAVSANRSKQTGLTIASEVAVNAKANPTADIQKTIGVQILNNPTYAKEITSAATVVIPQFSHVIAHTVAFNQPKTASDSVAGIFLHSRISNTTGTPGTDRLTTNDRPSAGAAITAALTTGILESTQLSVADRKSALQGAVVESVKALVNPLYNGTVPFAQSNGGVGTSTLVAPKGIAGGITGFVAQMVKFNPGSPTSAFIGGTPAEVANTLADLNNALFQASYNAGILTGTTYTLDIAQAAGQAFGWVSGVATSAAGAAVAAQFAQSIYNGYPVLPLASITNAVNFGIDQAAGGAGVPGVGARGLSNSPNTYYEHRSASGNPVSNIFSL